MVSVSMVAPLLYCRRPSWTANSCALSTALADPFGGRAARRAHQASPRMARSARVAYGVAGRGSVVELGEEAGGGAPALSA